MTFHSYLIPTTADHRDAHDDNPLEPVYRQKVAESQQEFPWTFEVVKGFFKQSEEDTDDLAFNYALEDLGRMKPWDAIIKDLAELNDNAQDNQMYKLLFLARHGQGYHNVVVDKYGYEEWYRKWHNETTDGEIVYAPDPMLTELGINQAKENNQVWLNEVAQGAPIPSKFYVSPLQRSSHTLVYTWNGIKSSDSQPMVTELIRETMGVSLSEKRSSKTVITERFGKHGFVFEDAFSEEDELFKQGQRESFLDHSIRINQFLQRLFDEDFDTVNGKVDRQSAKENTFVSTTSHAGSIRGFITVLEHRRFTISTGGMIPVVVKATRR